MTGYRELANNVLTSLKMRYLLLAFGIFMSSGYRVAQSGLNRPMRWDITKESPVLWVEVCDALRDTDFSRAYFPEGDALSATFPSSDDMVQSVLEDFNKVPGSFFELRWAGDEFLSETKAPNVAWSEDAARHRTIKVCTSKTGYAQAAHATPQDNSDLCNDEAGFRESHSSYCSKRNIASCTIVLDPGYIKQGTHLFVHVLTHEMGHCLGLLHNHETSKSVMSYLSDRTKTIRLELDDKMGLAWLYPQNPGRSQETADFGLRACQAAHR